MLGCAARRNSSCSILILDLTIRECIRTMKVQVPPRQASALRPSADAIDRSRWIDIARGVSILLVVMLHSALGVSKVLGTSNGLEEVVAFAKPFRMPGFFLLTGILAARADKLSCLEFVDRKVVRFVYFYFIWAFAILLSKAMISGEVSAATLLLPGIESLLEPLGSLWYIVCLAFPVFDCAGPWGEVGLRWFACRSSPPPLGRRAFD